MEVKRYGQTVHEEDAASSFKCREIVQEILRFGVNQKQIVKIIELLAMELEDRDLMVKVVEVTKASSSPKTESPKIIT